MGGRAVWPEWRLGSASHSSGSRGRGGRGLGSRSHWRNSRPDLQDVPETPPHSDFTPFDPTTYEELTEVAALHLDYLLEQRDASVPAHGFVFVRTCLSQASWR